VLFPVYGLVLPSLPNFLVANLQVGAAQAPPAILRRHYRAPRAFSIQTRIREGE
jgi:hypothetical protein